MKMTRNQEDALLFIAEISCNHQGSLEHALHLIDLAAQAGAGAVKFQTWAKGQMVADKNYRILSGPWAGRNLYELYEEAWTPWEWYGELFARCRDQGVLGFTTVFDTESLQYMEEQHNCPMYKIASFELQDLNLIEATAKTGKPMIISTGMGRYLEIAHVVDTAVYHGCTDLTLLHCVSAYPTQPQDCHLRTIPLFSEFEGVSRVGLSDHTQGTYIALAAIALGATVIEKHFTDDKSSLDGSFSLGPDEFLSMVATCRRVYEALGNTWKDPLPCENDSRYLRRSLYVINDIQAGEQLTTKNIGTRRPAEGLDPCLLNEVLGTTAKTDLPAGTPLRAEHYEKVP